MLSSTLSHSPLSQHMGSFHLIGALGTNLGLEPKGQCHACESWVLPRSWTQPQVRGREKMVDHEEAFAALWDLSRPSKCCSDLPLASGAEGFANDDAVTAGLTFSACESAAVQLRIDFRKTASTPFCSGH